ncbi:MAG: flagellar basal body-associated protein FliL [Rhodocyclaceae bacterium]|jgi:flagellar FliL protein|nr:hypothetical protein [Rhodocyclaceae bacterium]MCL4682043.1 flagellar basal body-associated protein FliL [Rhodocyclaceae bacterium]
MAKAPPKKEEQNAADDEAPPVKKKGKLPLIIGLVVLLAAAGGGAWFFLFKGKGDETAQQAKPQAPKPPVFVPLDPFTVNLAADENQQYLQVAATLKVLDQAASDTVKQYMPELRHKTLLLLSSKKPAEIASAAGQERLAEELRQTANNVMLAAAGRPAKPIVLDVPKQGDSMAAEAKAEEKPAADSARPEEGAKPEDATAEPSAPASPAPALAPATPPVAAQPATELARAAADDPVQSVFFTSFIIQ